MPMGLDQKSSEISSAQRDSLMQVTGWARIQLKDGRLSKTIPLSILILMLSQKVTRWICSNYLLGSENHLVEIGVKLWQKDLALLLVHCGR